MSLLADAIAGAQDLRGARAEVVEERAIYGDLELPMPGGMGGGGWTQGMATWHGGWTDNADQAMRLTAVWACLRLISEAIATLPIRLHRETDAGERTPLKRSEVPDYLTFPEPGLSKIDYLSQVLLSLLTDGNAYIATIRRADGTLLALIPLDPNKVTVELKPKRLPDGTTTKPRLTYTVAGVQLDPILDILHIKGMARAGWLVGLSPIAYAAETVGVGLNSQRYGDSFFSNGALASAVIEAPGEFGDASANRWRDTWNGSHQGVGNANKIGVLTNGAKLTKVSITPEEAQFLGTRQFTVPDVARVYGVPPHLIGDASNSTSWGSGLAEQNLAFAQLSLRPWCERIEEAHDRLLRRDGIVNVCTELDMDAVLRASFKEQLEALQIGVDSEVLVVNDARKMIGLPKVAWGDVPATVRRPTAPAGMPLPGPDPQQPPFEQDPSAAKPAVNAGA